MFKNSSSCVAALGSASPPFPATLAIASFNASWRSSEVQGPNPYDTFSLQRSSHPFLNMFDPMTLAILILHNNGFTQVDHPLVAEPFVHNISTPSLFALYTFTVQLRACARSGEGPLWVKLQVFL